MKHGQKIIKPGGGIETCNFSPNMEEPWDYRNQSEAQHGVHSLVSIDLHTSTKFTTKKTS